MESAGRLRWLRNAALAAVPVFAWISAAQGAALPDSDLASRFATAPETASDQQQLVQITLNGAPFGNQLISVSGGKISLPPDTLTALRISGRPGQALDLSSSPDITSHFDEAQATLSLKVPVSMLGAQRFAPEADAAQVHLSPETWGAYINYDVNFRHDFGTLSAAPSIGSGGVGSAPASGFGSWGGLADLRVLAPDVAGSFGYAYDSTRTAADAAVRLDSTLTWRPSALNPAVSAGDLVSGGVGLLASARPYRFGGVQVGTDYSGNPSWSSSPIASVNGTAQAQSAVDVYLQGQRTFHTETAGGPFSLVLPPGSTGAGTSVVLTDVTGRSVVVPIEVQRVDPQLLRQGIFLWSAGAGAPRFGYGSSGNAYAGQVYGYGNARYGAFDRMTATGHAEAGPGLAEAEAGADLAVAPTLAAHGLIAVSRSSRGIGGSGRIALVFARPWNLGLEGTLAHSVGNFDDVVSVSGRRYGIAHGIDPIFSLPATSEMSARLSWQASTRLSFSTSYQANSYKGSGEVGFASVTANYRLADNIPVFANLSRAMGGERSTAFVAGVTFALGGVQASVSGGYGTGSKGQGGSLNNGGYTGGVTASRPLGESVGDIGWDTYANRAPGGTFANADAQIRTGYGVPGVAVQSFGKQATGYVTLRGSAGVVGLHPFLGDPATGGIIIADTGLPGVPVQLNGYDKGRTSFDGKMALAGAVPGAPQRVVIDTAHMPIDAVPTDTDQLVVVRDQGAAVVAFGVRSASSSALILIVTAGQPPPVGSTLVSASSSAPISKEGRAYLPSLARNEVLSVEMPDGATCLVRTRFDGRGGVGRRLGPFPCEEAH